MEQQNYSNNIVDLKMKETRENTGIIKKMRNLHFKASLFLKNLWEAHHKIVFLWSIYSISMM